MSSRILCCIVAAAAYAFAQQKAPVGGPPKPFKLPPAETIQLKNGMQATMIRYGAVPKVSIVARIRVGNYLEGPNQIWLADLTGQLMKEGTATQTAEQVAQAAARMGGQVNLNVGEEYTSASADVLSEFGPAAIQLLASVIETPRLPEAEISRLKEGLIRRIAIQKSRPQALANERFMQLMYPDQPYGRIYPPPDMVKGYTIEDVRSFYGKNFGARRTHLYIVGRFDDAAMRKAVTGSFSSWAAGNPPELTVAKPAATPASDLVDRPGSAQSTLLLGLPVQGPAGPDAIPLEVTDSLLGGSFGSRITTNIREQKGYTYSPFSQISDHYHEAHWVESADVTTAVTGPALREIYNEIDRLRKGPPPADELTGIQNNMAGVFVIQNSSRQGVISQLAFVDFQGLPKDYLTNYVQNVMAVKPADVQRIAEKYLSPEKMTLVVVGDKAKIADQVQPFLKKP